MSRAARSTKPVCSAFRSHSWVICQTCVAGRSDNLAANRRPRSRHLIAESGNSQWRGKELALDVNQHGPTCLGAILGVVRRAPKAEDPIGRVFVDGCSSRSDTGKSRSHPPDGAKAMANTAPGTAGSASAKLPGAKPSRSGPWQRAAHTGRSAPWQSKSPGVRSQRWYAVRPATGLALQFANADSYFWAPRGRSLECRWGR